MPLRIVHADDHPIVRHGLRDILNAEADFRVVDEVEDGAAAVQRALEEDVHLAILDVTMPRMTGLQAARELEVLKLVAEGHTSDEIAELLVISRKTVDRHRANMLEKLGMRDRVELTRYAIRRGLIAA